jgi:hypothetical protein
MGKNKIFSKIFSFSSSGPDYDNTTFQKSFQIKLVIILVSLFLCSFLFTLHFDNSLLKVSQHSLQIGTPWQNQTLKADNSYPIFKSKDEYNKLVIDAQSSIMPVFNANLGLIAKTESELNNIFEKLKNSDASTKYIGDYDVNQRLLMMFLEFPEKNRLDEIQKMKRLVPDFLVKIYSNGIINYSIDKIITSEIIAEISPKNRNILKKRFLTSVDNIEEEIIAFAKSYFLENTELLLIDILKTGIKPNLIYSAELTEAEKEMAKANIPLYDGYVRSGEIIVEKGQIITKEINRKIESYRESKKMISENYLTPSYVLGNIGYALIIFSMILIYLVIIRKKIFRDNIQLLVLFGSLVFITFISWLTVEIPSSYPIGYLIPVPAIAMLIAIVFDSRTAFYATITSSLLLAAARGNDFNLAISFIFAGVLAAFTVRDIQNRTQMFRSIFFVIIGITFSILVFDLQASVESNYTLTKIVMALINASISPILTYGLLFLIEHTTTFSTDLRIKEFDNINHPLLKKMNEIALGTYQHTMNVAILAERCAIEIGANPLLTRVGAIFHDIGKISKPEYFTENQKEIENKLELIPPKKAVEIIKKHITDGIELGKQYKIPERILEFIPMHHGTGLIKHFYAKALEESNSKLELNEFDFRYPGPKPSSKETAILMICDSSEAISKVQNLSQDEIRNLLKRNINEKFVDGQFNESNLTFNDLTIIEETIYKNLLGLHQRTKYKEIPDENETKNS